MPSSSRELQVLEKTGIDLAGEPMPSSSRELQGYPHIPSLLKAFGSGPSGGNVLVPARRLGNPE